jgi:hypothetical protein
MIKDNSVSHIQFDSAISARLYRHKSQKSIKRFFLEYLLKPSGRPQHNVLAI